MEAANYIDFSFLESEEKAYSYSIMIVLGDTLYSKQFSLLKNKSDYVICTGEAANSIYDICQELGNK